MADNEMEELKARVAELEGLLKSKRQAPEISDDEMAAFRKVSGVLAADWGDFCGVNDCYRPVVLRCLRCAVQPCIVRCIYECSCGPCNVGGPMGGGVSRFEQFGG